MAVFTEAAVRANLRVRNGRRVFYLAEGDHLTPSARDWLKAESVEIVPAAQARPRSYRTLSGEVLSEKPEHMTHLQPDLLVPKTHPRIVFRGLMDHLQAEVLLCGKLAGQNGRIDLQQNLQEVLNFLRTMMRCDVLEEPLGETVLCGLDAQQLRTHSHIPQKYYDQPHFMPEFADSELLLCLNRLRTTVRQTELSACRAFPDRTDMVQGLNRLSSLIWILMIRLKKETCHGQA